MIPLKREVRLSQPLMLQRDTSCKMTSQEWTKVCDGAQISTPQVEWFQERSHLNLTFSTFIALFNHSTVFTWVFQYKHLSDLGV